MIWLLVPPVESNTAIEGCWGLSSRGISCTPKQIDHVFIKNMLPNMMVGEPLSIHQLDFDFQGFKPSTMSCSPHIGFEL
jgi:hypothetical protein